jgi:hypothetical protein
MFTDVLTHADLTHWAEMGLVIFVMVFVGTSLWAMSRPKGQVEEWAAIPLSNGRGEGEANGVSHD